jgi:Spy/CpxP family protein refolding chaperone
LERRLQDRINQVVRQKLALSDDQFEKLRETASRMEDARRDLRNEEVTTRFAMRQELLAGDRANEARVGELLDKMPKLERRRLELMEQEQRELAKFLSATQRARYLGLQDELRRSMQDLQRRRMGLDGDPPPANPRPGARRLQRPPAGVIPPP